MAITIYEYDTLVSDSSVRGADETSHVIPPGVYNWLEDLCLRASADGEGNWLRLTQRRGRRAVQVTSYVGVLRSPDGYQIEVLPKVGKCIGGGFAEARALLVDMLCSLEGFRHIQTDNARIAAVRMPLLEVFIYEFLRTVERVVKRGLRCEYSVRRENLFFLRGKLLIAPHLRNNLFRADRFFTEHEEFSSDRPENRLLRTGLQIVMALTASDDNQRMARELEFVFADVPASIQPRADLQLVKLDRSMGHYSEALAWVRLLVSQHSPLTGEGEHNAPSLLFPMEAVFEAYVADNLGKQLSGSLRLIAQTRKHHLVRHLEQNWFRLKPDLLVQDGDRDHLVLDTKWKLLDTSKSDGTDKYGLSQGDFYQLHAYGQNYLDGKGDVMLVYPKTDAFEDPLPVFVFPKTAGLRLWVVPFCLKTAKIRIPVSEGLQAIFA